MPVSPDITSPLLRAELRRDVLRGLGSPQKWLPPKWLYDATGSKLFEQITALPDYYPFPAERALLESCADAIAEASGARTLIELGSGASEKSRLLLDALRARQLGTAYVPVDVSASALSQATDSLRAEYPGLTVAPVVADFTADLELPPVEGPRLVAFLGGTFGNLLSAERSVFLRTLRSQLAPGDRMLLGCDLVKDPAVIRAAYDDPTGVTSAFSKNALTVLNREFDGDFDLAAFDHTVLWDSHNQWIEMRLRSRHRQTVTLRGLGLAVTFAAGEDLRTEISAKFEPDRLADEVRAAGLEISRLWTEPTHHYGLALISPAPASRRT
ncbi:L-histidine N(alpha)-methyltransferase [Streptomyces sp. NPDC006335]|uniref:L-histidine N(alpha)-methyltransferase n=1 Tax=Streptomyces sp. NPDC006335 TaxID=3156895 RepID=UPI0033B31630